MTDVLVRSATDGSFQNLSIAAIGAVTAPAAGGLDITANEISLDSTVAGKGILNTAGILSVVLPGRGAKTAISTAGAGTLTAAGIVSGLIMRTGPTGAYDDTTDTATAILALLNDPAVGDSFEFSIVNGVAHIGTMLAGAGITLAGVTANAASKVRRYHVQVTNVGTPAVTITGIGELVA